MAALFDTGALERLRRGQAVAETLAMRFYPPVLCTHVVGEYFYGLEWSKASELAVAEGRAFLASFEILTPTIATASIYGRLRSQMRSAGRQLPDPDFWIAAHAIEERVPVVSTDRHFELFDQLDLHLIE